MATQATAVLVAVALLLWCVVTCGAAVLRSSWDAKFKAVQKPLWACRYFFDLCNRVGTQSKLKIVAGVCQCFAAVPTVYNVDRPDSGLDNLGGLIEDLERVLEYPSRIGTDLILPGACSYLRCRI